MLKVEENINNVKEYYDKSTKWYDWFYYDKDSLGLHYGFWQDGKDTENGLINQYKLIKELLDPKRGEIILDAGCGVGGASIWLAENTAAKYIGVTISKQQVKLANKYISQRNARDRVEVIIGNYLDTKFPDNHFDKIFGIESMCYTYPDPSKLYKEMYRVLKPGGKFVISDGVYLRKPKNSTEKEMSKDYCLGFKLLDMLTPVEIKSFLSEANFEDIQIIDKTKEIKKSVDYIDRKSRMLKPLRFLKYLKIVSKTEEENLLATLNQKKMHEIGLFGYSVFIARKPIK